MDQFRALQEQKLEYQRKYITAVNSYYKLTQSQLEEQRARCAALSTRINEITEQLIPYQESMELLNHFDTFLERSEAALQGIEAGLEREACKDVEMK